MIALAEENTLETIQKVTRQLYFDSKSKALLLQVTLSVPMSHLQRLTKIYSVINVLFVQEV